MHQKCEEALYKVTIKKVLKKYALKFGNNKTFTTYLILKQLSVMRKKLLTICFICNCVSTN